MSHWLDIVDWVGGFPYEVATPEEISISTSPAASCSPVSSAGASDSDAMNSFSIAQVTALRHLPPERLAGVD